MKHPPISLLTSSPSTHVGFQLSQTLWVDEGLHWAAGVGVGVLGMAYYMRRCRKSVAAKIEEAEGKASKAAGNASSQENAQYFFGMKAGYMHAANLLQGK